jgi:hypothetical protein
MGVGSKSLLGALAGALAVSACQQPAPTGDSLVVAIRQLDDEGACATAGAPSQSYNDALGWQWFQSGGNWCRRQLDGGASQAWALAEQNPTHRLHLEGGRAGLTDALPALKRLQPGEAALGSCEDSRRMRAFRDQNWLIARGDLDCRGHRATSQQVVQPIDLPAGGQRVPILLSRPAVPDDRGTIIFLTGGPYRNLVRGLAGHALTNHLLSAYGADAAVLVPAYAGTDKLRTGEGDLARATVEIEAVMAFARERRRPICVVAYDMGAYALAPLIGANVGSGFLLLAPFTSSPTAHVARMKANGAQPTKLQLVEGAPDAKTVETTSDQALLRYAGDAARQDLNERLGPGRLANVEMAYAPNDPVVGPRDLAGLSSKIGGGMTRLPAVGHAAEEAMTFMAYQPALDRFLSSCLANPAN